MNDSTPTNFQSLSVGSAKRTKARDNLFLVAELRVEGRRDTAQVRVHNLSPGGLMAEYPHPLEIGCAAEIELRGIGKVTGRVAWATAGRVGVAFDRPIDPFQARKPIA